MSKYCIRVVLRGTAVAIIQDHQLPLFDQDDDYVVATDKAASAELIRMFLG